MVIELDRVQTRNGWAPFYARMISLASTPQVRVEGSGPQDNENHLQSRSTNSVVMADPEIPGVAQVGFTGNPAEVPAGTRLVWKTEPLVMQIEARPPQLNTSVTMH